MAKIKQLGNGHVGFYCPACEYIHALNIESDDRPRWSFNGDYTNPTFAPSILVHTGALVNPSHVQHPDDPPTLCHSFVTNGSIEYLNDCTHNLAGKTIGLPNF